MRVRPIHFVPDLAEAVRFYEALGLRSEARSRSGHWVELTAAGGDLGLHNAAIAADGQGRTGVALNFVADEPLEAIEQRLRAAGFPRWADIPLCPCELEPAVPATSPPVQSEAPMPGARLTF